MPKKKYSDELKLEIVEKKGKKPQDNKKENEDILAELKRLRMENEYLKKLNALIQEREKSQHTTK